MGTEAYRACETLRRRAAWVGSSVAVFVLLSLLLLPVSPSAAEELLRIGEMQVQIWPEYDDPRVLVMYLGTVARDNPLPREIRLRVPSGAAIGSACNVSPDGKHSNDPYRLTEEDGYAVLSYTLTQPRFHMEFYYSPLDGQPVRSFTYSFHPLDPVEKLKLEVQEPLRATGFVLSPAAQSTDLDAEGFKYYHLQYENVLPGQPIDLKVSYTKPDTGPSKPKGSSPTASAGSSSVDARTMTLVVGGVMVVGLFYFVYVNYGHRLEFRLQPADGPTPRRQSRLEDRGKKPSPGGAGGFCTECGAPLDRKDRFCSTCGTKARRPPA